MAMGTHTFQIFQSMILEESGRWADGDDDDASKSESWAPPNQWPIWAQPIYIDAKLSS